MLIAIFNCTEGNSDFGVICTGKTTDLGGMKYAISEWLGHREEFGHEIVWDGYEGEVEIYGNHYQIKIEVH